MVKRMGASSMDPIARFEHDHAHVNALVLSLREALGAQASSAVAPETIAEVQETLRLLKEDLLSHFALEEEGLFPVVLSHLPDLAATIQRVVDIHDRICGALTRLLHQAERMAGAEGEAGAFMVVFERFEEAFAEHAREERELLRSLDARLGAEVRKDLADVLRSL